MFRFRNRTCASIPALLLVAATMASPAAITTAPGFRVEQIYSVPEPAGSWVAIAVDPRGRLVVSDQYGSLHRVTLPSPGSIAAPAVDPLTIPIGGAHGLAFVGETLFAVVAEKVHGGPGLFRVRDANGDGELDEVTKLTTLEGTGEHGPHAVVMAPDGKSLYVVGGNGTRLPPLARAAARPGWADASPLPPIPALIGSETRGIPPGGWICRTDLEGREWTLLCAGFRNHYDLAIDRAGELFTFDSDTEFEINLPWYRPTRVLHAVSGGDFGWRPGAAKLPSEAPETLPPVIELGLGSPTGMTFGYGATFPARYREALIVADWSYGRLIAVHLQPSGASYRASSEEIARGLPLPITDLVVNPRDGALYFVTGGRRMQSALYRVTWDSSAAAAPARRSLPAGADGDEPKREKRRSLERFHGVEDRTAIAEAWPYLGSSDRHLRAAAIRALESQPVATWRPRALEETRPAEGLACLLALARSEFGADLRDVLRALERWPIATLSPPLQFEKVRLLGRVVAAARPTPAERARLLEECNRHFPSNDSRYDAALGALLVALEAPRLIERLLERVASAPARETQITYAGLLRHVRSGWTIAQRQEYFRWLQRANEFRGGAAFRPSIQLIRKDALATLSAAERHELGRLLEDSPAAASSFASPVLAGRTAKTTWTMAGLWPRVEQELRDPRNVDQGRQLAAATGCFACHTLNGEGGALGPDLSGVGGRFSAFDLLEAIIDPSRTISDQYGTVVVTLKDGVTHHGRLVNQTGAQVHLNANLFDPTEVLRIDRTRVMDIAPGQVSLMPPGLLDLLSPTEVADLLAFLRTADQQADNRR